MYSPIWMLLATSSFTLMAYIIKLQSSQFAIPDILFYRSIASIVFVLLLQRVLRFKIRTSVFRIHARRSLCGLISMSTWYYTLGVLPMGVSVTLNYMSPLFLGLMLYATGSGRERPSATELLCILAGFAGVAFILDPFSKNIPSDRLIAVLCGVAAAFIAALAFKDVKVLKRTGENEWQMVFYFSLLTTVVAAPLTSAARLDFGKPMSGYFWLLVAGILGAMGQFGVSKAFGSGNQMVAASLQYLSVIFSLLISWVILGEVLTPSQFLGIAIIIGSAIFTIYLSTKQRPS